MQTVSTKPQLVSASPHIVNTGTDLEISLPVTNLGQATASRIYITDLTLGAVRRTGPAHLPLHIGNLAFEGRTNVGIKFSARGLAAGARYLLTVRGTFGSAPVTAFTISRYITVPAVSVSAVITLRSHISVALGPASWSYTVHNTEASGSPLEIAAFHLDIAAPLGLISSPPGWVAETDSRTYVAWFTSDPAVPRIAAGASLSGFAIQSATTRSESTAYSLVSWNRVTGSAGPVGLNTVLSPMRP